MIKKSKGLLITGLLILGAGASQAADVSSIVKSCNDCHGKDGVSQWTDVPTIAGVSESVHEDALYIFADEGRPCAESRFRQGDTNRPATTMCAVAADLSEEARADVATYYAKLSFVAAKQDFDPSLAAAGEAVHKKQCEQCHSDGGSNPDDEAGILAGQWKGYLKSSFAEYTSGKRDQPSKMKEKMDALSADDVKALLDYYASQQ
ncbi:MAG: c-type cytochrome [Gammaproteobacteria bacterium]|nr:c-type cytochrome [Gammaproteobacteria bacterium]MDH5212813.1 c-type cytochrome [Gammaproteobacteria bacterium]MDH5501728.1 c-type cytochrome [Gammaproteobacteria bacterium]